MKQVFDVNIKAGTAGGTLLTIFANISSADFLKTAMLAAVGAMVSFCVTIFMKFVIRRIKK